MWLFNKKRKGHKSNSLKKEADYSRVDSNNDITNTGFFSSVFGDSSNSCGSSSSSSDSGDSGSSCGGGD
ncbi:hypothetical protein ACQKM9_18535 [Viridibacillus sp. NPDC093762]|uniref:hypothetical protein n=1 Tax=Viridibacillus sp. NPDC093762 TaxID=3390720 RepID=UPI003D0684C2